MVASIWDDIEATIAPSNPCRVCPQDETCFMFTSNDMRDAYNRGCRNSDVLRVARRERAREKGQGVSPERDIGVMIPRVGPKPEDKALDPDEALWLKEEPFQPGGNYFSYRKNAYCSTCGELTKRLSARGTVVCCDSCGNAAEAETQRRIDIAIDRIDALSKREKRGPEGLTLGEQVDLAADCGLVCDGINGVLEKLTPGFTVGPSIAQRVARTTYRLEMLKREFYSIGRSLTYEDRERAGEAMTVLEDEIVKAREVISELDNAYRYIEQARVKELPAPPPVAQETTYNPELMYEDTVDEYWPGEQLNDGPYYCQMAGHIGMTEATIVMYLGYDIEPGRKSWAEKMIFACAKHSDIGKLLQASRWEYCWNVETLTDE